MTTVTKTEMSPQDVLDVLARHILVDGYHVVMDVERSRGSYLYDARSDRMLLDFYTNFATYPVGYNHPATAEPEWPSQPQWPARPAQQSPAAAYLAARLAKSPTDAVLWAASSRDVTAPTGVTASPGVQSCVSCGLSLSATARFCRRCGTAQQH